MPQWHHDAVEYVLDEPRKRITARVSEKVRATLEQAAQLLGATVNQFLVRISQTFVLVDEADLEPKPILG